MEKKIPPNKSKEGIYKSKDNNFSHENFMGHENIASRDDFESSLLSTDNSSQNNGNIRKPDLKNFSIEDCDPRLAADIAKDINKLKANPKAAKLSDKVFDAAYKKAKKESDENPYDTASQCQFDFMEEFGED